MRWVATLAVAILMLVAGCSAIALTPSRFLESGRFESAVSPEGERMALQCKDATADTQVCELGLESGGGAYRRASGLELLPLSSRQEYLGKLVSQAAADAVNESGHRRSTHVSTGDVAFLQVVAGGQSNCLADRNYADLMVACPVPAQHGQAVVFMLRGLCDRCRFEPVVMRRVK